MINIFIGALIFSIWCVTLFFGKSIGLSMLLFIAPLTYYLIYILEKNKKIANQKAKILIIPIILLASTYFIFNNSFFNSINKIAIPTLLVIMIMGLNNEKIELKFELIGKFFGMFLLPISFIEETFETLIKTLKEKLKINIELSKKQKIKKVMKALGITIPLVLVVIILLSSADEIFANIFWEIYGIIFKGIAEMKVSTVILKILLTACAFVYFICFFDYITTRYEKTQDLQNEKKVKDNFTIKMILTTLNIIYLVFCYIQIKSLFLKNVNINYAHYARQGFFQLMIVSIINLITILIAKKSEIPNEIQKNKYIKVMCLIMIAFTFIILISSAVRMYYYESAYGYTLLRLLVYCTLLTETILLIPTIIYIIDKKINLLQAYFTTIITIYVLINFANFDNIIAKRNVDRYIETGKIDMYYLRLETGTDAVNQIIRILENNENEIVKQEAKQHLENLYDELENKFDIREFNISKMKAKTLIEKSK